MPQDLYFITLLAGNKNLCRRLPTIIDKSGSYHSPPSSSVEHACATDTPTKLVSGMERSYVHTAWKSVMAKKTALLSVVTWPSMIRPETSVCCVDSLDILLYNVGVCNIHSNPLQKVSRHSLPTYLSSSSAHNFQAIRIWETRRLVRG